MSLESLLEALQSQSPRIGAVFPTDTQQFVYSDLALGLNPLESGRCFLLRIGSEIRVDGASLNPLESGRCFLRSGALGENTRDTGSQSPRIGAVFPTSCRNGIPAGSEKSQSPRIGAVFPTQRDAQGVYSAGLVSIPSNRGGVSYVSGRMTHFKPNMSQSPRIGAVFPTIEFALFQHGRVGLNPLESGRCFLRSSLERNTVVVVCLNPLESGRCFLHTTISYYRMSNGMSQSPRIGAVFPTVLLLLPWVPP